MDKKITRRVVLGAAIAGLVAGPFVVRAMRGKSAGLLSDYDRLWKHYFDQCVVPIGDVDVTRTARVVLDPTSVPQARLLVLTGQFGTDQDASVLCGSVSPAFFAVLEASLQAEPTRGHLCVDVGTRKVVGRLSGEELLDNRAVPLLFAVDGTRLRVVVRDGDSGSSTHSVTSSREDVAEILEASLSLELPQDGVSLGTRWMRSVDCDFFDSLPTVVEGVCSVRGVEAFKIVSSVVDDAFRPMPVPPVGVDREQLAYYKNGRYKGSISEVLYVSTDTGLLIRSETLMSVQIETPTETRLENAFSLSQMFFS